MEIIVGKNAGFCFGVKRAVDNALDEVKKDNKKVYCLGELVHNKEVINKIEKQGIEVINSLDEVKDSNAKLIIRAHGIDKETYNEALKKGLDIVDLTCPLVNKTHEIAKEYSNNNYYIFLVGSKIHPEIIGTSSYCGNNYTIIEDESDVSLAIAGFTGSNLSNLLVIVQTTYSKEKFNIIENLIKDNIGKDINIVIKNTICNATELRQIETDELSKTVDLMIIIGGKNSSNTKKLYEIAKKTTDTLLIETYKDININDVKKYDKIGIMAGTSTPRESLDDVVQLLNK